ncbi:MAG: D-ribose pyranase [Lachnospirales bacterium]
MYKKIHINREINEVLGKLGHTDKICIADPGLPIPKDVKCIDLSYIVGKPSFLDVYESILDAMIVEDVIVAREFRENADETFINFTNITSTYSEISHSEFKELTRECKAIIRTGQGTPYANVLLTSKPFF